ncbi:MAG TPA: hypothetical protein IAA69_07090 [Candidatus Aveggerthella stercoripullorum]|uniref:Uncharacterized protein n=1 Tax=Candidatus Aveggerthella stercoripullorum TaxID=2840688 RepID=A0A9D1A2S2_9ACTN|nr:hypothetical protein [Candidatus Aveggerthella stercoripullorum]
MTKAINDWKTKPYGRVMDDKEMRKRSHWAHPYCVFDPGAPVDMDHVEEMLKGGIDVHIHGAPIAGKLYGRPKMTDTCIAASEVGMKALVFKDHNTMTNNAAVVLQEMLDLRAKEKAELGEVFTPVQVFGGITLNYQVGGMNKLAVEAALNTGRCKEIWLPSMNAAHQHEAVALPGEPDDPGIRVSDCAGTLTPEMIEILDVMAQYNDNAAGERVVLSACHVSNEEKFDILDYINRKGLDVKVLMDHVTQEMTIVTPDEAKQMIDMGGYLEFAECSCIPWPGMGDWIVAFDYSFDLIKELIKEKGPENLVLITDAGQPGNEPITGWRWFLKWLLGKGVSESDINVMFKETPAMLLGKI